MTKSEQILETIKMLREARANADEGPWQSKKRDIDAPQVETRHSFFNVTTGNFNDAYFIALSANKMDQLCEALELCVQALQITYPVPSACGNTINNFNRQTLTKAAEILAKEPK